MTCLSNSVKTVVDQNTILPHLSNKTIVLCLLVRSFGFALYSPPRTWQGGWRRSFENKAISQVTVVLTTHLQHTAIVK